VARKVNVGSAPTPTAGVHTIKDTFAIPQLGEGLAQLPTQGFVRHLPQNLRLVR
jgi:hypothetical protein